MPDFRIWYNMHTRLAIYKRYGVWIYTQYGRQYVNMCSDMCNICPIRARCAIYLRYTPYTWQVREVTRAGRSAAVNMAEPGELVPIDSPACSPEQPSS